MNLTFVELNQAMLHITEDLMTVGNEMNKAMEDYLTSKARHEQEFASFLLQTKVKNPQMTAPQIEATARTLTREFHYEVVRAESKYRKLKWDLRTLNDRLSALKEVSYNLRRESQI